MKYDKNREDKVAENLKKKINEKLNSSKYKFSVTIRYEETSFSCSNANIASSILQKFEEDKQALNCKFTATSVNSITYEILPDYSTKYEFILNGRYEQL